MWIRVASFLPAVCMWGFKIVMLGTVHGTGLVKINVSLLWMGT